MTPNQQPHRTRKHYRTKGRAEIRAPDDDDEETPRIRMPVSSTAEDRDGDEFTDDGLADLARQLNAESERTPMFLDHGMSGESASRYGLRDMAGYWDSAEIVEEDGVDVLYAEGALNPANEAAEWLTDYLDAEMPIGASVGFRALDADGDREQGFEFNATDLLEISMVGIPSNPETVNAAPTPALAKAVDAASDGFDADTFVREFQAALADGPATDSATETETDTKGRADSARDSVTETDDDKTPDDSEKDSDGISAGEFRERMLETQQNQMEALNTVVASLKEDDDDDDDDDEDNASDDGDDDDDDDDDKDVDADDGQKSVTVAGTTDQIKQLHETLTDIRADESEADDTITLADSETEVFREADDDQTEKNDAPDETGGWL